MSLLDTQKQELQSMLINWVKRVTAEPATLPSGNRPTPAEVGVLPEIVDILINEL